MKHHDSDEHAIQSKRESAYFWGGRSCRFAVVDLCRNIKGATTRSSKRVIADCLQRYPSLDRPALSQGRSVAFYCRSTKDIAIDIGYQAASAIQFGAVGANTGATSKQELGRKLCKRNQSSSQQLLYLDWPVVWTTTWSAALQAQAQVLSLLKFWVLTARARSWQVLPLASFATTQVFAAKLNNRRANIARLHLWNRRRGFAPAAVLRFGDGD